MTDDDIDGLAAEYVLGSLDPEERRAVATHRMADRTLRAAVDAWERRLATMSDCVPGVEPPPDLFDRITARLKEEEEGRTRFVPASQSRATNRRWRAVGIGAAAFAACLAVVAVGLLQHQPATPTTLVSTLHKNPFGNTADETAGDKDAPAFAVVLDLQARAIEVRTLAARPNLRRSYELWLTPQSSAAPVSLGIIAPAGNTAVPWKERYTAAELAQATLAVSLEPEGGSATGQPTGPILFVGKLSPGTP
jgi:anti-sigma-K factor RskA